ncbi:MAG: hypothetical protein ACLPPV_15920 [Candidatus Korobacteraceae bacterium]|jgi:hypothetical protein
MGNGLLGSSTLEVLIGLIFVYLLLAIICTTMNEWIAGIFKTRSTTLKRAIVQLLDQQPETKDSPDRNWFLQQFYAHPLIAGMSGPKKNELPAYLSARTFATAVMDIATPRKPGVITFADLETGINNLPAGDVKTTLLAVIQTSNNNLQQAQKDIEAWFNDTMDRVSGWYKRTTQIWTVIIAAVLVLCANADTLQIAKTLWTDPTLRAELVEQAKARAAQAQAPAQTADNANAPPAANQPATQNELDELGQVVGWSHQSVPATPGQWADHILGWILSIVAVSLGAPFWFDLLNKFMRIRNGGDAPEETIPSVPPPAAG